MKKYRDSCIMALIGFLGLIVVLFALASCGTQELPEPDIIEIRYEKTKSGKPWTKLMDVKGVRYTVHYQALEGEESVRWVIPSQICINPQGEGYYNIHRITTPGDTIFAEWEYSNWYDYSQFEIVQ